MVDALAVIGDEGRGSLRKASGSWQISFDPEMSEWGNTSRWKIEMPMGRGPYRAGTMRSETSQ